MILLMIKRLHLGVVGEEEVHVLVVLALVVVVLGDLLVVVFVGLAGGTVVVHF